MPTWGGVTVIWLEAARSVMLMLRSAASARSAELKATALTETRPLSVGVVGGEEGVVDELDPRRDLAKLGDQAGHRLADDGVALRRTPAAGCVAKGDEGVVERVAVGFQLIGGGGLGAVEGVSSSGRACTSVIARASSFVA